MYLYIHMGYQEEIPMEEAYRLQLREQYFKPRRRSTILIVVFAIAVLLILGSVAFGKDGFNYLVLFLLLPFGFVIMLLYAKLKKNNLHYFQDSKLGFIIKEQMTITKVFHTPAGINIYWLDSDDIKTFTPDPYRHFNEGDTVWIYYLRYSRLYLAYEMPGYFPEQVLL